MIRTRVRQQERTRAAGLALLTLLAFAAPSALLAQAITPEQIVTIEQVGSVALSPDGQLVAFTLSKPRGADEEFGRSRSELWIVPAAGGTPRAIVTAPQSAGAPEWSPDGATLAFTARMDDDGKTQVYGVPAVGGEPRQLTHSPHGVMSFDWAPEGRSIAYTAREPESDEAIARRKRGDDVEVAGEGERHVRLWIEDLASGERRAVTPADRTVRSFAWAPDASGLALQITETTDIDASYMFRQIFVTDARDTELQQLTETKGKLGPMAWSPRGDKLAFIGAVSMNDPLAQSVLVVPTKGGAAVNRTPNLEATAQSVGWLDNDTMYFTAATGTRTTVYALPERGEVTRIAGGGSEILGSVSFDSRMRRFATSAHTSEHPREVYVGDARNGQLHRVTTHNDWLDRIEFAQQETITWEGADGWQIEGVLVRPLNHVPGVRYPLAILPHGGPEGISYDGWTTRALYPAQYLAANGYAVLMPNYRGSGGRGVAFSKGDHRDLGGKEFKDVIAGIDHLAAEGLVDPERVGISGTSYGGYFSAWAGTKYSDRFKAAITFAGISNWASFTGTTDIPYEMSIVHWDTWWFDDPGLTWDRSPLAHINGTKTAILVGHGLADPRVHPAQSLELYTALRIKGVPTGLLLYPREPHGLLERAHQLDFMQRMLKWFDEHVKGDVPTT
jgi:dipeptidyl aminopeptidase/acylaminoacyl peptidase